MTRNSAEVTMQYIRETVNEQINHIEPHCNITFNELQVLYRKASKPARTLDALIDAFVFGYAMGQKAAAMKNPQRKEVSETCQSDSQRSTIGSLSGQLTER